CWLYHNPGKFSQLVQTFSALDYHGCTARRKALGFLVCLMVGGRRGFAQTNQDLSDYPGPAGLMAGAAAASGLAMTIFMERNTLQPMGVRVQEFVVPTHSRLVFRIPEEAAR